MLPLLLMLAASTPGQVPPSDVLPPPRVLRVEESHAGAPPTIDWLGRRTAGSWSHTFYTAAKFTVPRFGEDQKPLDGDAMVIYEGMKLAVDPSKGTYELNFTATVPPTPVTVRLQLVFSHAEYGIVKLTLPPIRVENEESVQSGNNAGQTVRINQRGFSELFQEPVKQSESSDIKGPKRFQINQNGWTITRIGSARFGSARTNSDELDR